MTLVPCLDAEAEHCQKGRNMNITKKNAEILLEASNVGAQVDAEWTVLFILVSLSYKRRIHNIRVLKNVAGSVSEITFKNK
jgi:hypothetical protein